MSKIPLLFLLAGMCTISAQEPEPFVTHMQKAWNFHTQKAYDSASNYYVMALENYSRPKLAFSISTDYKDLARELERIFDKDQKIRIKYLKKNYPQGSEKRLALVREIQETDAENLRRIEEIIEENGWLGPDKVGYKGSKAFFYVIQHADLEIQQKYLPMIIKASSQGYVELFQLAYLIDRISLREKRLLMFGSEVRKDPESGNSYVAPTYGIEGLNFRRKLVGLKPMSEYVKKYDMRWDDKAYKESLPDLMEKLGFKN